jgi:hypothetical protein
MKKNIIVFSFLFCVFNSNAQSSDTLIVTITKSQFAKDTSYVNGHNLFTLLQITNVNKLKSFDVIILNDNNDQLGSSVNYQTKVTSRGYMYVENTIKQKCSVLNNTIEFVNNVNQSNYLIISKIKVNYIDINNLQRSSIYSIIK